ncbi:MAG: carboxypeptidase regulatory-like domain-containing protein [Candidatus Solibacter usitatus]|nr:carboxypeptidase regulatory-like domain-containing protein [Candidatus Solibacter usitatus]
MLRGAPVSTAGVRATGTSLVPGATTDSAGHYQIRGSLPGNYRLTVEKDGTGGARPRSVNVLPGSHHQHVDIELLPEAILSGKVLDAEKRPVANSAVGAWVKSSKNGHVAFLQRGFSSSDDTGSYRIAELGEGHYYLIALAEPLRPRKRQPASENAAEAKPRIGPQRFSFYPNTTSWESSVSFGVGFGEQREGLDLVLGKTPTYCVFATVSPVAGQAASAQSANLVIYVPIGASFVQVAQGSIRQGEELEVCGLPPGAYSAVAKTFDAATKKATAFAKVEFVIVKRDVDLGTLHPIPGATLSGSIAVKDSSRESSLPSGIIVTLDLKSRPIAYGENRTGRVAESGHFSVEGAFVDDYGLIVSGLPDGYYVHQALQQGRDAWRGTVRPDGGDLQVVLGADGPVVSGQATDRKNQPVEDAIVALVPEGQEFGLVQQCDQRGQFRFSSGVRPGSYRIIALSGLLAGEEQNPDAIRAHLVHASTVDLAPRQQAVLAVTVRAAR